jgi:hypothetical protein
MNNNKLKYKLLLINLMIKLTSFKSIIFTSKSDLRGGFRLFRRIFYKIIRLNIFLLNIFTNFLISIKIIILMC